jgi:hypothetical protein
MTGIYCITNKVNGKQYVGQSVDTDRRWKTHKRNARKAKINMCLYHAMRKYGIDKFEFEVLEECEIGSLTEREVHYVNQLNTMSPHGYNAIQPDTNPMLGVIPNHAKTVIMKDFISGEPILTFPSSRHAFDFIKMLGLSNVIDGSSAIRQNARGEIMSAYRHRWEFANESEVMPFCLDN